jgi:hypothetical protein
VRSTPGEIVCKDGQARAFIWEVHNIISACDDIESKTLSLMAPKPRDRGSYRTGERVLVPHTDKFYVAKVVVRCSLETFAGHSRPDVIHFGTPAETRIYNAALQWCAAQLDCMLQLVCGGSDFGILLAAF